MTEIMVVCVAIIARATTNGERGRGNYYVNYCVAELFVSRLCYVICDRSFVILVVSWRCASGCFLKRTFPSRIVRFSIADKLNSRQDYYIENSLVKHFWNIDRFSDRPDVRSCSIFRVKLRVLSRSRRLTRAFRETCTNIYRISQRAQTRTRALWYTSADVIALVFCVARRFYDTLDRHARTSMRARKNENDGLTAPSLTCLELVWGEMTTL